MFSEILQQNKGFWSNRGPNCDIVLSTRMRLARNMDGILFTNKIDSHGIEKLINAIRNFTAESKFKDDLHLIDLNNITNDKKRYLRERNLITYEMEISECSYVLIDLNKDFAVFINDEDHFRIQVIRPGLQLVDTFRLADDIDDELNRFVPYAFSDEYGYLTACPSNLGTGLKLSAMLHLPVINLNNRIPELADKFKKMDALLIESSGKGLKSPGSIYQISNKTSLGISEIDIIEHMDAVIKEILDLEDSLRDSYVTSNKNELEDKIWRSFGVLKYSRSISYTEAVEHLSNIRLGVILAVIKKIDLCFINDLMVNIQWSHLQTNYEYNVDNDEECNEYRAEYLRINLNNME